MKTKMYLGKSVKYQVVKAVDEGIFDVVTELIDNSVGTLLWDSVFYSVWAGLNVSLLSPIFETIEDKLWEEGYK